MAEDDDLSSADVGPDACVWTNGQAAFRESDSSLDISVDEKIFIAGEPSPEDDRLTDDGGTLCWLHRLSVLPFVLRVASSSCPNYTQAHAVRQTLQTLAQTQRLT